MDERNSQEEETNIKHMQTLITNLIRTQELIDGLSIALAIEMYDFFAQGINKILLDDLADKYGTTKQNVASKMRNLQNLKYISFLKDDKMIAIERGDNYHSFFVGGEVLLVDSTPRRQPVKKEKKSLEDLRAEKVIEWKVVADELGMRDKVFTDFVEYWTAEKDGKLRYETIPFHVAGRMRTFIKNDRNFQSRTFSVPM